MGQTTATTYLREASGRENLAANLTVKKESQVSQVKGRKTVAEGGSSATWR